MTNQSIENDQTHLLNDDPPVATAAVPTTTLSKNAQKKLLKLQRFEAKKAEKKAIAKEQRKKEGERKRKEWEETLAKLSSEEERTKLIESRKELRKERMDQKSLEREKKMERLTKAKESGQKIVIDLEFSDLMMSNEIHSLVQQIMYCYALNSRCSLPAHLWLTGCNGDMETQLQRLPGFDKWMIEKESNSYIEALKDQKENLVYLTADSETVLDELDPKSIYIVGGLVDRNRWKGITIKKAEEQGIRTAKLPIGQYLKMCSSQVLTVNQVFEILLKFIETRDWKVSFFEVIPQRKRIKADTEENPEVVVEGEDNEEKKEAQTENKKQCVDLATSDSGIMMQINDLPENLLLEVFGRLPEAKSVIRCQQFPEIGTDFHPFLKGISKRSRVVASCNDLLLCRIRILSRKRTVYCICNPLTRQYAILPPRPNQIISKNVLVRFMCDPYISYKKNEQQHWDHAVINPNYKYRVVFVYLHSERLLGLITNITVREFSSETNEWTDRNINLLADHQSPFSMIQDEHIDNLIFHKGMGFWISNFQSNICTYDPQNIPILRVSKLPRCLTGPVLGIC
ncbi:uncharacterized protein [Rutidosis leptorrhynchoides]|uniref:uncharacterized protein n=1 Tax=Rutidosis leptorrhynchoides TaxID=125765 RepID=UPI003A9946C7